MDVQILFGTEEIKQIYEKTLQEEKIDIVCLANQYALVIGDFFDQSYAPRLYGGKTVTREILPDTKENRLAALKKDGKKNQVRLIGLLKPSESDLMLFDNQVIVVSYNKKVPYALVITDRELVASFQSQFEALWSKLK